MTPKRGFLTNARPGATGLKLDESSSQKLAGIAIIFTGGFTAVVTWTTACYSIPTAINRFNEGFADDLEPGPLGSYNSMVVT